jgi:hypothetical protein
LGKRPACRQRCASGACTLAASGRPMQSSQTRSAALPDPRTSSSLAAVVARPQGFSFRTHAVTNPRTRNLADAGLRLCPELPATRVSRCSRQETRSARKARKSLASAFVIWAPSDRAIATATLGSSTPKRRGPRPSSTVSCKPPRVDAQLASFESLAIPGARPALALGGVLARRSAILGMLATH